MDILKKFDSFINEKYKTADNGNWIVYSTDNKVIGCNLTHADAQKLAKVKGEHKMGGQNGKVFGTIEDAQKWLDNRQEQNKQQEEAKLKTLASDPLRKQLLSLSNLLKRRFTDINPFLFTYWISKTFGISKFLFITKVERSQHEKDIKNVYCIIGEYYYDINGFHTQMEVMNIEELNKWNINDFTFRSDLDKLKTLRKISDTSSDKKKQEMISTIIQFKNNIK